MTRAEVHRLLDELPDERLEGMGHLLKLVKAGKLDPDQAWFWTDEWQAGEREVDEELKAGNAVRFDSDDAFIAHLKSIPPAERS